MISEETMKLIGGPAFPQPCTELGYSANTEYGMAGGGMSLRDYFAGQALVGMGLDKERRTPGGGDCEYPSANFVARRCYDYADAMIRFSNQGL